MRGKVKWYSISCSKKRITPAHAGKRYADKFKGAKYWDHPRTCGEKLLVVIVVFFLSGSPPHMRGKDFVITKNFFYWGITPAHAGKSGSHSELFFILTDHPRTCGEKAECDLWGRLLEGSPPHMRGKGGRNGH